MFTVGMFQLMEVGWSLKCLDRGRGLLRYTEDDATSEEDDVDQDNDSQWEDWSEGGSDAAVEHRPEAKGRVELESEKCDSA